jgi:hypothetical protein
MSSTVAQRPGRLDLEVTAGDAAVVEIEFVDAAGDPVDVSGRQFALRAMLWPSSAHVDLDEMIDDGGASAGVVSIELTPAVTTAITPRSTWFLRDDVADRTLIDGELRAYAPGWAGARTAGATVVITNTVATLTIELPDLGVDPYAGPFDGGAAPTDYAGLTLVDGGSSTSTPDTVIDGGVAA